jgi:hypothetical protein
MYQRNTQQLPAFIVVCVQVGVSILLLSLAKGVLNPISWVIAYGANTICLLMILLALQWSHTPRWLMDFFPVVLFIGNLAAACLLVSANYKNTEVQSEQS